MACAPRRRASVRTPRFVISGCRISSTALRHRSRRLVRRRSAGEIGNVRFLPVPAGRRVGRHLVGRVVQPRVPFRRHLRTLDLATVENPAAAASRPGLLLLKIPVPVGVGAYEFSFSPGEQRRSQRSPVSTRSESPEPPYLRSLHSPTVGSPPPTKRGCHQLKGNYIAKSQSTLARRIDDLSRLVDAHAEDIAVVQHGPARLLFNLPGDRVLEFVIDPDPVR